MSKIPKRNGVAQAALGRKPTTMPHRNTPRGGSKREDFDEEMDVDPVPSTEPICENFWEWWVAYNASHDFAEGQSEFLAAYAAWHYSRYAMEKK